MMSAFRGITGRAAPPMGEIDVVALENDANKRKQTLNALRESLASSVTDVAGGAAGTAGAVGADRTWI